MSWIEDEAIKDIDQGIAKVFHELWASQIGHPGYDKKQWQKLAVLLAKRGVHVQVMVYVEPSNIPVVATL